MPQSIAFGNGGLIVAVGCSDGTIKVFDYETMTQKSSVQVHNSTGQ